MAQIDDNILIIGVNSVLGRALSVELEREKIPYYATFRRSPTKDIVFEYGKSIKFDMTTNVESWPDFSQKKIKVAFLFAAITSQEKCRESPNKAYFTNVLQTVRLGQYLVDRGIRVIFPSTNLVFDGSKPNVAPSARYSAKTLYGKLKAEAETLLLSMGEKVCVVRFPKILSADGQLIKSWLRAMRSGDGVDAFSDLFLAPINVGLTNSIFLQLISLPNHGIYQISSSDQLSYSQMAETIAKQIGATSIRINSIKSVNSQAQLEHCPTHVTLDSSRILADLDIKQPTAQQTIQEIIRRNHG